MIKNKSLWAVLFMFLFMGTLAAQERTCASHEVHKQMLLNDPTYRANQQAIETSTADYVSRQVSQTRLNEEEVQLITIPVVFHIVHNGDAVGTGENLSENLINAQLQQLNQDYRKINSDRYKIPDEFKSLHADFRIEFCLATRDPQGNETTGIVRHQYSNSTWDIPSCNNTLKPETIWDRDSYLNIWSVKLKSGLLGYAQFPGGAASTDGVVCTSTSFGSVSTPNPDGGSYGRGRTTTHEVGHWLNLRHIWGDDRGACTGTDHVADTPNQADSNGGSPTHPVVSCDSNDMFMNYMDYVADTSMYMFTTGQKNRSRALFASGGTRSSLLNSQGCSGGGNPDPDPTDPTDPSEPCSDTVVKVQIKTDRYGNETSWTLKNSDGTIVAKGDGYRSSSEQVYTKEVCLKDGCYEFEIKDSGSDGICCSYGNGYYRVYVDGTLKISGGEFSSSEKKDVCVNTSNDSQAPTAPSNLKATEVTDSSITISWNASTDNVGVKEYDIYVNNQKVGSIADTTAKLTKLNINTEYSIYVVAKDAAGNKSAKSNTIKATTGSTDCDDTKVVVKLTTDRYASETSWDIKNSSGSIVASGKNYSKEQSYLLDNCLADGCYTFTIRDSANDGICCKYGNGSYQLVVDGKIIVTGGEFGGSKATDFCVGDSDTIAPTAPSKLTAKQIEKTSATLFWSSSSDNIGVDKYNVYSNGKFVGSTKATTYSLTGLTANTKYSYSVKAEDAAGNISQSSNVVTFTTKGDVSGSNKLIITVTTDKYGSETSWDVKDSSGKVVASKSTFANETTDKEEVDLASGCYTFTIYDKYKDGICCKYGDGSYKVELNGKQVGSGSKFGEFEATEFCTTGGPSGGDTSAPTVPANLRASNVSANSANLTWTASSDDKGVSGYKVYINNEFVKSVSSTSYAATGLTARTSYSAYVVAFDAAGNESKRSDSVSFRTAAGASVTYCELKGSNSSYEWIDYVKLGDMENTTASDNGYGDYTDKVANIARGAQATFIASAGFNGSSYKENWQIWIDYNQNGTFDSDELIGSGSTPDGGNGQQVFTVPATAKLGLTRLRVAMRYGTSSDPCGSYGYGEVEDYSVNISDTAAFTGRYTTVDAKDFDDLVNQSPIVTYPNPVMQGQAVQLRARDNMSSYKIYDMSGRIVSESSATGSRFSLSTEGLNKGSYIVVTGDGRHQFNESIVIQ